MKLSKLPPRIYISGFMGSGKTTIGQYLADEVKRPFLDLDDKIVENAGKSIPEIFKELGEKTFRTIERKALMEVSKNFKGIVSLGGGSLQNQHMVDHLKLNGLLVFIETPISVILDRISEDKNRPLLLDEEGYPKDHFTLQKDLKALYDSRLPLYEQAEVKILDDGSQSPGELVEHLIKKIRNHVEYY